MPRVDLPHPDSPTMPRICDGMRARLTSSTARRRERPVRYATLRWLTPSTGPGSWALNGAAMEVTQPSPEEPPPRRLLPRVEHVPHRLAEHGKGRRHDHERHDRAQDLPGRGADVDETVVEDHAPVRRRRLHPEAEEGEPGLDDDGARDVHRHDDEQRRQDVGEDYTTQDGGTPAPQRNHRLDVLVLALRQRLGADEPPVVGHE